MRPPAAISVLLASGGLLAGCGGAAHTASSVTRSSTTSASSKTAHGQQAGGAAGKSGAGRASAGEALTRARAQAFAGAVNLRASDVPGFRSSPKGEQHTAGEQRIERELLSCVGSEGAGAGRGLVASGSGTFQRQASIVSQSLSSEVSVARTPALAAKQLAAFRSGLLRKCLARYVGGLLDSQRYHGAKISPVTTKQGSPPAAGTTGSFGLRFTATLTLHSIPIPLYIDILGFVDGSAEVSLFATGLPEPVPARVEEHLFSLLLARAKSHPA